MDSADGTPLIHLLQSNEAPSSPEYDAAQRIVGDLDVQLDSIDAEMTALEDQLAELKRQRISVDQKRLAYSSIISARRRIPPEIIGRVMDIIWSEQLGHQRTTPSTACVHPVDSPIFPFMRISREWYRIASGICHFWQGLNIKIKLDSIESVEPVINGATKWYERAGSGVPLSLVVALDHFPISQDPIDPSAPENRLFLDFIHHLSPRFSFLSIDFPVHQELDQQLLTRLFHPPTASAHPVIWSNLHTLSVKGYNSLIYAGDYAALGTLPLDGPSCFPLLRTAELPCCDAMFRALRLPWANLSTLSLSRENDHHTSTTSFISILEQCTNLERCSIFLHTRSTTPPSVSDQAIPTVTAPRLKQLTLVSPESGRDNAWMLLYLRLPSLQSINWTLPDRAGYHMDWTHPIAVITALISFSNCSKSFTHLRLIDTGRLTSAGGTMERLFRQASHLTHFDITGFGFKFISSLPPRIKHITLRVHSLTESLHRSDGIHSAVGKALDGLCRAPSSPLLHPDLTIINILAWSRWSGSWESLQLSQFYENLGDFADTVTSSIHIEPQERRRLLAIDTASNHAVVDR